MEITPTGYAHLVSPLLSLANGKVAVVLEGGYCVESLSEGAAITLKTLLGDPCPTLTESLPEPCDEVRDVILNCIHSHRPFWKSLRVHETYEEVELDQNDGYQHVVDNKFLGVETYGSSQWNEVDPKNRQSICRYRLRVLKDSVDLSFPSERVCIFVSPEHRSTLEKLNITENWLGSVAEVVNHVADGQVRSGICIHSERSAVFGALNAHRGKR